MKFIHWIKFDLLIYLSLKKSFILYAITYIQSNNFLIVLSGILANYI